MQYRCCDDRRRELVRAAEKLGFNGIDYVDVVDGTTLNIYFVNPLKANALGKANLSIEGGPSALSTTEISIDERLVQVRLNKRGDGSRYTLQVRSDGTRLRLDPQLSSLSFTFTLPYQDNKLRVSEQAAIHVTPEIDYLSKDYLSFRQLMLDRLATLLPGWSDPGADDSGVMLVELLAYVGDHLSYQQDVLATEAYLGTARRRISVRRHARMLDYVLSEGCNARVWVQVQVNEPVILPEKTPLLTSVNKGVILTQYEADTLGGSAEAEVFETLHQIELVPEHNKLSFYTWGAQECVLPKGATSATLKGRLEHLRVGDVLIFQERCDPRTGHENEADPDHRHVVRLTQVDYEQSDPLGNLEIDSNLEEKPTRGRKKQESDYSLPITEISWHPEDALPFSFPISILPDYVYGHTLIEDVTIILGNIVLADHGYSVSEQVSSGSGRVPPYLQYKPLTYALPYNPKLALRDSAYATTHRNRHNAVPSLTLSSGSQTWLPRFDLLKSSPTDTHFVVEVDDNGWANLRFGDNRYGFTPEPETLFDAHYRIGNGVNGNVGPAALTHIVLDDPKLVKAIDCVSNPLAALGGSAAQSIPDLRQKIARTFITQERGVTAQDYKELALRHPEVSDANAVIRWMGSGSVVFLTVERKDGRRVDDAFLQHLEHYMQRFRMVGRELRLLKPVHVSLDIGLEVCVRYPYQFKSARAALQKIFSNQQWADGQRGLFFPGAFTLGQPVYLSSLYAAASAVAGVTAVNVTRFQRQNLSGDRLQAGLLALDWLEVAHLDNNPEQPGSGRFHLHLKGDQ